MQLPAAGRKIRIAVVEIDPLRVIGLRSILDSEPDFEVHVFVGIASVLADCGADVVLIGSRSQPDLAHLMADLKQGQPDVRMIVSGAAGNDDDILQAISAGAKGYIDEAAPPAEYHRAIREVHNGSVWAPRRVLAMFIERVTLAGSSGLRHQDLNFTARERQVLRLVVAGRSNREIGIALGIEPRTVKAHLAQLMRKAGVRNRLSLSVLVVTHALLSKEN